MSAVPVLAWDSLQVYVESTQVADPFGTESEEGKETLEEMTNDKVQHFNCILEFDLSNKDALLPISGINTQVHHLEIPTPPPEIPLC